MVEAKRQKDCFMEEIRKIKASIVEIVDIDDICENGIVCEMDKVNAIVDKMKIEKLQSLSDEILDEDIPRFAVVGRPNAGKSSIVNAFIGEERNIRN